MAGELKGGSQHQISKAESIMRVRIGGPGLEVMVSNLETENLLQEIAARTRCPIHVDHTGKLCITGEDGRTWLSSYETCCSELDAALIKEATVSGGSVFRVLN